MKRKPFWITVSLVLIAAIIISAYVYYEKLYPSTDDAYIQANVVNIAAQISGPVDNAYVSDHAFVKKNQLLFTIDSAPFVIAKRQAEASLAKASADLITQQKDTARILSLVSKGQLSNAEGDNAQGKLNALKAAFNISQAGLQKAILDLQYTRIAAPADGYLTNFLLRKGEMVQAGAPLFALVENQAWWADANFKETDLARIRVGQPARIQVDIYPSVKFSGIVQGISAGSGAAFALLPPENATGNWVKVTQRFPVRINIIKPDPRYPLRIGASSTVTVDTKNSV